MKTPHIDLKELEEQKKQNFLDRLKFIDQYVQWMKKQENKTWSTQQKKITDKK